MDFNKAIEVQKQIKNNVNSLQTYITELQSWESEMKRKEAALKGEFEQDLPPVRSKVKKEKPVVPPKKEPAKRIKGSDYNSWDKFDVDKACEDIDMAGVGPTSLDGKKSAKEKEIKLRDEAHNEKERGNNFVKQEKWDEAIACYNRAIELVKDDAIYYANRGLCYLKKDSLHKAEKDCTEALRLDPNYVKALQRRGTAREHLGSLRAASEDLARVIELEPQNAAARKQLLAIKARMGTKGKKGKSSPQSPEAKPITGGDGKPTPKIVELTDAPESKKIDLIKVENEKSDLQMWRDGDGEPITVIKPVKKPPHLRSKRPLKPVTIQEISLGNTEPNKPATRLKIIEVNGDSNNKEDEEAPQEEKGQGDMKIKMTNGSSLESEKYKINEKLMEKNNVDLSKLVPPTNSVQFMQNWKNMKGCVDARLHYLSLIDPTKIPTLFTNALESDVLSELLSTLDRDPAKFKGSTVSAYLRGLASVKRFSALAMFLSDSDKLLVKKLLDYSRSSEKVPEEEIEFITNKFEL